MSSFIDYFVVKAQLENAPAAQEDTSWRFGRGHGSLFDRGSADSYYRRGPQPHYGGVGGDTGPRIEVTDSAEIAEYMAGYEDNEKQGFFKEW